MASVAETETNQATVGKAFSILREGLAPFVCRELVSAYGDGWWTEAVLEQLSYPRNLPIAGSWDKLEGSLDIAAVLALFTGPHWRSIMSKKVPRDALNWAMELKGTRNKWAHMGSEDFSDSDTWRALDTMSRLASQFDAEGAEEINKLLRKFRYGSEAGSTAVSPAEQMPEGFGLRRQQQAGILNEAPVKDLKSWREIIEPHPDVARGLYKSAEFAADLHQVASGSAAMEYQDPQEFFARTFVTEGMQGLLEQALRRVAGREGEPVIQLKTAFGGGKTHSMLALYHMLRNRKVAEKIPAVREIMDRTGLDEIPETASAVVVGTALSPAKSKRPSNLPGVKVNTLWGEIAYQLALARNDPSLYEYVREADKKGISPGSEDLKNLFDAAGPVLILLDELVAYAKVLHGQDRLPAGTFDNFISFIQSLTEAARASRNACVVASIPESQLEVGGEAGAAALTQIEHTFGRMEAVWKPVAAHEGFEVVRRRLFLDCKDEAGKEAVCEAFSRMYAGSGSQFPIETHQLEYKRRLLASYPIHPEMFDRLYEDWGDLERFQKTRGVLRLMAAVIHQLWMGGDHGLLIMPGSVPLNEPRVRDELTRYLPDNWNAIVDREIDGMASMPYQLEQENPRFTSSLAARRVARTIMLGSAPIEQSQKLRGLESSRIRLGSVQPGENPAVFTDALGALASKLAYLYDDFAGDRYWYDTRPTLRKTAADKAHQFAASKVNEEIERRLRKFRKEAPFAAVHIAPLVTQDVKDEPRLRLVVLPPDKDFVRSIPLNSAVEFAGEILESNGSAARVYRNTLLFVAPDQGSMISLRQHVRQYLAWQSIYETREDLDLGSVQIKEVRSRMEMEDRMIASLLQEAYSWLLIPSTDASGDLKAVGWEAKRLGADAPTLPARVREQIEQDSLVVDSWDPQLFNDVLQSKLWREGDHISISQIWDHLATYLYLERLTDVDALLDAVRRGVQSGFFAYASGWDPAQRRYEGLVRLDAPPAAASGLLVRSDAARRQFEAEAPLGGTDDESGRGSVAVPPKPPAETSANDVYFHLSADLDPEDVTGSFLQLYSEIVEHLQACPGAKLQLTLDVTADQPDGFDKITERTVLENCRALGVHSFGFEK